MRARLSERAYIPLGTCLILLMMWGFVIVQIANDRHRTAMAAAQENQSRVEGFQQYVLRTLAVADLALDHAAVTYGPVLAGNAARISATTDPAMKEAPFVSVVLQQSGKVLVVEGLGEHSLSTSQLLRARKEIRSGHLKAYVSPPLWNSADHNYLIAVSRSFGDVTATAWLRPRTFTDFADRVRFTDSDLISLIGLDGITRARRTGNRFSTGEDLRGRLVMARQAAHPNGSYIGPSSVDQVPHYFSHRRLPEYGLFATSGISSQLVQTRPTWGEWLYWLLLVLASIAIVGCAVLLAKATARKRVQVADLGQANRRFAEAQRLASVGDWNFDFRTGSVQWSETLCEMYQRPADQAVSSLADLSQYFDSEDQLQIAEALERIAATGDSEEYTIEAHLPDGSTTWHQIVAAATLNEDDKIIGVHGTDQDISERRRVEVLEAQLANHSRTDAMNALAATLAHELNQPLASASNYLAAAMRSLSKETGFDATYCIGIIESAAQQIHDTGDIIKGARELVSNEAKTLEPVLLEPVIAEALHLLEGLPGLEELTVDTDVSDELTVLGRKSQLRQVFFNLLKNGFEAARHSNSPKLNITSRREDAGCVRIEVRDNGIGIDPHGIDPFSALATTKATGLGLGLSIARTIIEAHGGRIWIPESGPGGTVVAFTMASPQD